MAEDGDPMASAPFEGPEKLLEIWFAPSVSSVHGQGLRGVDRAVWEEMLSIVKCQVLSVVQGKHIDAYLLRYVLIQHFGCFCIGRGMTQQSSSLANHRSSSGLTSSS